MRPRQYFAIATVACSLLACDRQFEPSTMKTNDPEMATGFLTEQPAQARTLLPQAALKPIISVGDPIPGLESNSDPELRVWAPIPDGLGAYSEGGDLVLFANHELTSGGVDGRFPNARVSRLVLDRSTLSVQSGSYAITGKVAGLLFQRLCSATFIGQGEGFAPGWFFTGEESTTPTGGGMQLAVRADGAETKQLPWLGRFAHENYIGVPGFGGQTVMVGTDDTSPALGAPLASELYMYVAADANGVLNGSGKLYVFTSSAALNAGALDPGKAVEGAFVEVTDPAALTPAGLQARVDSLNAFKFVRLEDVDYDRGPSGLSGKPAVYFVDTGSLSGSCGATPCDPYGSIYRMEFDPSDPPRSARLTLLARSRGVDAGDWASPDNIAVSHQSLMLQEDPAYSGFTRPERIWNFKLGQDGTLGEARAVVELKTQALTGVPCNEAQGTCWESSGIIDASEWLGEGTWLFDVQAHTLPFSFGVATSQVNVSKEGGQLLYLRVPGT